jgi:hypothetical protein
VMYEAGSNVSIGLDLAKDRESGTISIVPSQVDRSNTAQPVQMLPQILEFSGPTTFECPTSFRTFDSSSEVLPDSRR